jgi:hypothetical protein
MNSFQPKSPVEVPQRNWLEIAKRRFFGATIHGSGRYLVAVMDHVNVYCFETYDEAATFMAGKPYRLYDLNDQPPDRLERMRDPYPECRGTERIKRENHAA